MNSRVHQTVTFLTLTLALIVASQPLRAETPKPPNVVFVLADDLGWSELGCYGNGFNETPHLDALAKHGMRFTQAYAAAPVCSPYRAAFLTGQSPARTGIIDYLRPNSANALSTDHITLAETFQQHGYATGMVGKWHLTGYKHHNAEHEIRPTDHGFQWNIASEVKGVGNGANFWPYVFRTQPIRWLDLPNNRLGDGEFLTDRMNLEAIDFIERNKHRPFFLYLSHYAPHTILNGRPDLVDKYRKKHKPGPSTRTRCYFCQDHGHQGDALHHWAGDHNPHLAAMLESIDDGIGRITAKLKELGLDDNTIVIFTSDNGGETNVTSNSPLRGGKSQLYEGGIRVPLIVRWLNNVPAGTVCDQPTVNMDFYPTLAEAAGIAVDKRQTLDGVSTLATWKQPAAPIERDALFWHYPLDQPHFLGGQSSGAIRVDDWKLIEDFDSGRHELYSLANDPSEARDLSESRPDVAKRLATKLANWRRDVGARVPSPPLLTIARNLYFADHFSTGQVSNRWFFNKDWVAEGGVLQRAKSGSDTTRIFVKDATYKDVVIRFDFQMQEAKDVRLMTGSSGHYNAVIHIRPDHFYVQTAMDEFGPYFSYRHGECAYEFKPDRWYTMTVEIIGDQLVAHLDRDHLAYAKHPILDKERTYFALQVDDSPAAFDNIQILQATKHPDRVKNLNHIQAVSGKYPVQKPLAEQFEIQKRNAHEWFYQRQADYRSLVKRVDGLDELKKQKFPEVFRSHKEFRKQINEHRKRLHKDDVAYRDVLFATHRAQRAITAWLIAQSPSVAELPMSRREREIERLRAKHQNSADYLKLVAIRDAAQKKLEAAYPILFMTDDDINQHRKEHRAKVEKTPEFKEMNDTRAAAYREQQDYLIEHDPKLVELRRQLEKDKK